MHMDVDTLLKDRDAEKQRYDALIQQRIDLDAEINLVVGRHQMLVDLLAKLPQADPAKTIEVKEKDKNDTKS